MAKTVMILGTQSHVGKSVLTTALCRIFAQEGYRVAPFKAQNMSLNAGVTPEGGEIARATLVQAEAAGVVPHVDMNPVLLKPEGMGRSQLILNGRPVGRMDARNWMAVKRRLWQEATAAFDRLAEKFDLVILEGAGSPVEINLKAGDIANLRMARYARAPALLVADIDRGGVFAALVGTLTLLEPEERRHVRGFVLNKFRGDPAFLGNGLKMLRDRGWNRPTLGVIPYLPDLGIAEEDSVALDERRCPPAEVAVDLAVLRLPRISNFDEFDALAREPGVRVRFVHRLDELGTPTVVLLPGTKTTLADLAWLRESGLAARVVELARRGVPVVGICGGYQMMGVRLEDPEGVEAETGAVAEGLGLLPIQTIFGSDKRTAAVRALVAAERGPFAPLRGTPLSAYEIHVGRSEPISSQVSGLFRLRQDPRAAVDGAMDPSGRIWGTYLHGLFDNDILRHAWLASLGWRGAGEILSRNAAYNRLADHVRAHLDLPAVDAIIRHAPEEFDL